MAHRPNEAMSGLRSAGTQAALASALPAMSTTPTVTTGMSTERSGS